MHHHADQCGRKMGPQGVNAPARRLSTLTTTTVGAPQLRRGSHLGRQTQPGRHRACQPEPVRGGGEGGRGGRRHQRHLRHRRQLGHQRHLRHLQHLTFRYHDLHDNQKDAMSHTRMPRIQLDCKFLVQTIRCMSTSVTRSFGEHMYNCFAYDIIYTARQYPRKPRRM